MSRSFQRRNRKRTQSTLSTWHTLRKVAIFSFLGLAVISLVVAVGQSAQVTFGQSVQTNSTCSTRVINDNQGQPVVWTLVHSEASVDVMSSVKCTDMFRNASKGVDLIAQALKKGKLADPVLEYPYRSDVGLAEIWIVPVIDSNNHPLALLTFIYDASSHLLRPGEFAAVTGNMFYVTHSFPAVTSSMAVATVSKEQHVALYQAKVPELIYFPPDFDGFQKGKHHWNSGGTTVLDPIWRVPGADSHWHYIDHDGHAHHASELPVETKLPSAPDGLLIK